MKRYLVIPVLLLTAFSVHADDDEDASVPIKDKGQYQECVGVSLFTLQGRELNSIVNNNRMVVGTNEIPEGWSVVGVTTKTDAEVTEPYLVICH